MMKNLDMGKELSNNAKKTIKYTLYFIGFSIIVFALIVKSGISFLFIFLVSFPLIAMAFSIKYIKQNHFGLPIQSTRRNNKGIFSSLTLFIIAVIILIMAITGFDEYRETSTAYGLSTLCFKLAWDRF